MARLRSAGRSSVRWSQSGGSIAAGRAGRVQPSTRKRLTPSCQRRSSLSFQRTGPGTPVRYRLPASTAVPGRKRRPLRHRHPRPRRLVRSRICRFAFPTTAGGGVRPPGCPRGRSASFLHPMVRPPSPITVEFLDSGDAFQVTLTYPGPRHTHTVAGRLPPPRPAPVPKHPTSPDSPPAVRRGTCSAAGLGALVRAYVRSCLVGRRGETGDDARRLPAMSSPARPSSSGKTAAASGCRRSTRSSRSTGATRSPSAPPGAGRGKAGARWRSSPGTTATPS